MSDIQEYIDLIEDEPNHENQEFDLSFNDAVKIFKNDDSQDEHTRLPHTDVNLLMQKRRKKNRRTYDMCEINGISMQGMYPDNWFRNR